MLYQSPDTPRKITPRQQYLALTSQAAQANIRAHAHHTPGIAPAGVRLAHLHTVACANI
jgi:hypothetical protein